MPQNEHGYRVFTRRFDRVVAADELRSSVATEKAWSRFVEDTADRRVTWDLLALERASTIRASVDAVRLRDTLVTLLVDHSGSMRGAPMLLTAAAVDVACSMMTSLGVSLEVLGFTTRSWKGGWSRRLWAWCGRRSSPGRLCDLLHIVYLTPTSPPLIGAGRRALLPMLDPKLLKENVDGEALLWAASRQDEAPHGRRAIIMLSDGAPVDDSTLLANGPYILMDHLKAVVGELKATRSLAQVQIGCDYESVFPQAIRVESLEHVGTALLALIGDVLGDKAPVQACRCSTDASVAPDEAASAPSTSGLTENPA